MKKKPNTKLLLIVAVLLVGGYLFLRHSSTAQAYSGAPGPTGDSATTASDANGQEGASDQGSATSDLLSALGAQNAQLLAGFQQSEQTFAQAVAGYANSSNTGSFGSQTSVYTGAPAAADPTTGFPSYPTPGPNVAVEIGNSPGVPTFGSAPAPTPTTTITAPAGHIGVTGN